MTDPAYRCTAASRAAGEQPDGTASTVRAFLLVETPGPWGVHAVQDSRLPDEVKGRLLGLQGGLGIRPLLVRRPGRAVGRETRVYAARSWPVPTLQSRVLHDVRELLGLDLEALGNGPLPGFVSETDPVFLVCTHGRHDVCCAELGRPVARALAAAAPARTWEVSHVGGDRFAPNVLVLPHGLYYGRLPADRAGGFARTHLAGRLDLEHLRGRSAYPFAVQAAELHLRRHLGDDRIEPYPLASHRRVGRESEAVFEVDGRPWTVRVVSEATEPALLTCRATVPSAAPAHRLLHLAPT